RSLCRAKGRSRSRDQRVAETLVDTAYWAARFRHAAHARASSARSNVRWASKLSAVPKTRGRVPARVSERCRTANRGLPGRTVKTLCSSKSFGRSLIAALISLVKIFPQQGAAESIRARKSQISCVLVDIGRHCVTQNFLEIPP